LLACVLSFLLSFFLSFLLPDFHRHYVIFCTRVHAASCYFLLVHILF
jgi:hypothetical protein